MPEFRSENRIRWLRGLSRIGPVIVIVAMTYGLGSLRIAAENDLFGTSVDLAARLVDHAQPGQIIASDVVRQLAAGKDFLFSDLGETELRGFEDPVKLWELRWREAE